MPKILVTGATGNVGSRLIGLLAAGGHSVRALTRRADHASLPSGVEVAIGDFTSPATLRAALADVTHLYLLAAGHQLEEHEANAIDAAQAAGLELIVKHSVAGAQYKASDIPRWHRAGEERLEASGLPYVFLRPAPFASNALAWASTVKAEGTVYGALGDAALPVIDPQDIAEAAVTVLTTPGHAGRAYELSGPEALTTEQQVDALGSVLGRPLKYVNVPDSAVRDAMLGMGMPPPFVEAMISLIQTLREIDRVEPTPDCQSLTGHAPRPFRQWAEANAALFR